MEYCGLDLGRRSSAFCVLDEKRAIVREGTVRNEPVAQPELVRATRQTRADVSSPSRQMSANPSLSWHCQGRHLDCTISSYSNLCPGTEGPIQSTYRWVSRGSNVSFSSPLATFARSPAPRRSGELRPLDAGRSVGGPIPLFSVDDVRQRQLSLREVGEPHGAVDHAHTNVHVAAAAVGIRANPILA